MEWQANYPPEFKSAARARADVAGVLAGSDVSALIADQIISIVGELASNAARHARTDFIVTVIRDQDVLRVEVFDRDTRPPALVGLDDQSTSGRGLHIVAALASDWGWHTAEDDNGVPGKVVWAGVELTSG
jgi:anti-sigma regulatory factor (Ser/Thr protein kinase)